MQWRVMWREEMPAKVGIEMLREKVAQRRGQQGIVSCNCSVTLT